MIDENELFKDIWCRLPSNPLNDCINVYIEVDSNYKYIVQVHWFCIWKPNPEKFYQYAEYVNISSSESRTNSAIMLSKYVYSELLKKENPSSFNRYKNIEID